MRRSSAISRLVFHPSTLAVGSGLIGALVAFLINILTGGNTSSAVWIALAFTVLFSLGISARQVYSQEKTGQQWMLMLQESVFQTYFLTLLTEKHEVSQIAQQRLGQVLQTLNGDQQVSMLRFFGKNGLPARFIGDALVGSDSLAGADLRQVQLPQIQLAGADLSRVVLQGALLTEANLSGSKLYRAQLAGAQLPGSNLTKADLTGVNLQGANLAGADLSHARVKLEKAGRDSPKVTIGTHSYHALRANLSRSDLSLARLKEVDFTGADLAGAQLQGADLTKANLCYANLQGANLTGAQLREAALIGANLQGADLSGAVLTWAVLDDADLRGAVFTQEQWESVVSKKNARVSSVSAP